MVFMQLRVQASVTAHPSALVLTCPEHAPALFPPTYEWHRIVRRWHPSRREGCTAIGAMATPSCCVPRESGASVGVKANFDVIIVVKATVPVCMGMCMYVGSVRVRLRAGACTCDCAVSLSFASAPPPPPNTAVPHCPVPVPRPLSLCLTFMHVASHVQCFAMPVASPVWITPPPRPCPLSVFAVIHTPPATRHRGDPPTAGAPDGAPDGHQWPPPRRSSFGFTLSSLSRHHQNTPFASTPGVLRKPD